MEVGVVDGTVPKAWGHIILVTSYTWSVYLYLRKRLGIGEKVNV